MALFLATCVCLPYPLRGVVHVSGSQPLSSSPRSPRIAQLERTGDKRSLQRFWTDVQKQGSPLIEAIPSDADHYLVTFLWRAQGPLRNVLLVSGLSNESYGRDVLRENILLRITGTDVWYRSYRVRSDARFTYRFSVNDSLVPSEEERAPAAREAKFQPDPLNRRHVSGPTSDSLVELPGAPPQEWFLARDGVPKGDLNTVRFPSKILHNERQLTIYTPPAMIPLGDPTIFCS